MNTARQKMLDKVRAIISKTTDNGCTENEALAALAKAQELMNTYDISETELGVTTHQEGADIAHTTAADPYKIRKLLGYGIAKFTRTKAWVRKSDDGVSFCGLESEIAFASWLLDTLAAFVMRELKEHQQLHHAAGDRCPRIIGSSFVLGCTQRINARLIELSPSYAGADTGNALVVSRNALITEKLAQAGIHLRNARRYSRRVNDGAFAAGKAAGDRARFDRPVVSRGALRIEGTR